MSTAGDKEAVLTAMPVASHRTREVYLSVGGGRAGKGSEVRQGVCGYVAVVFCAMLTGHPSFVT